MHAPAGPIHRAMPTPSKRKKPQPSGQEEIVAAIVDAAESLFAQYPIDQVTTRQLAASAGVNLGTIHRYFGSKEEVLRALMQRYALHFREHVAQFPEPMAATKGAIASWKGKFQGEMIADVPSGSGTNRSTHSRKLLA